MAYLLKICEILLLYDWEHQCLIFSHMVFVMSNFLS